LQRVIAGLKFSSRNALGCVWAGIAFMSYRKYMGTSFPQNIQESWTFLLHALNLQSLFDLAFLNIYEGGNKKTLAGIPLNGGIVYERF
jgi:hypothetical protein